MQATREGTIPPLPQTYTPARGTLAAITSTGDVIGHTGLYSVLQTYLASSDLRAFAFFIPDADVALAPDFLECSLQITTQIYPPQISFLLPPYLKNHLCPCLSLLLYYPLSNDHYQTW